MINYLCFGGNSTPLSCWSANLWQVTKGYAFVLVVWKVKRLSLHTVSLAFPQANKCYKKLKCETWMSIAVQSHVKQTNGRVSLPLLPLPQRRSPHRSPLVPCLHLTLLINNYWEEDKSSAESLYNGSSTAVRYILFPSNALKTLNFLIILTWFISLRNTMNSFRLSFQNKSQINQLCQAAGETQ